MKAIFWMIAFTTLTTLGAVSCQSGGNGGLAAAIERSETLSDTSNFDSADARVRIENTGFPDVAVYVISEGGMRMRIGMANGNSTTVLTLPRTIVMTGADLRFVLRSIGGGDEEISDKIFVVPGDEVVLTLMR